MILLAAVVDLALLLWQWVVDSKVKLSPEEGRRKNEVPTDYPFEEEMGLNNHNVVVKCAEIQSVITEDISYIGLTNEEIAAVEYVKNVQPSDKVLQIQFGSSGSWTLKGRNIRCLIQPSSESDESKFVDDKVIDCCINFMDLTRHNSLKVMTVDTYNTLSYAQPETINHNYSVEPEILVEAGRQFLKNDLVFFPIYDHYHWYVGVMNCKSKQFQILDSKSKDWSYYDESTLSLREGIQFLIALALSIDDFSKGDYDIITWDVVVIKTPQQNDNHSCGLFTLKFIEFWKGSQECSNSLEINAELYRKQLVRQLIFLKKNELKNVQNDIRTMFSSHNMDEEKCHFGAAAMRSPQERNTRLKSIWWGIWNLARKKKEIEGEEVLQLSKQRMEIENGRRGATADMSEDLSEGEKGEAAGADLLGV